MSGLDMTRLENVNIAAGKTVARCPACAETGRDKNGDHLFIGPDGKSVRGFRGVRLQTTSERPSEPSVACPELPFSDASDAFPNTIAHTRGDISECPTLYAKTPAQPSEASEPMDAVDWEVDPVEFEERLAIQSEGSLTP